MPYVYLIHCRASVNNNENVYKIGKSVDFNKRLDGYDKGSIPIISLYVSDCDNFEKTLINIFDSKYKQRTDYGREYYDGDVSSMINTIIQEFNNHNMCYKINCGTKEISQTPIISLDYIIKSKTKLLNKLNKINVDNINLFQRNYISYSSELNNIQYYNYINNYINSYIHEYNFNISKTKKKCKFGDYLETNYALISNLCNSISSNKDNLKLIEKINILI